jgi:protein AATF/BFR2
MAPISAPGGAAITWHETQIDELFASLLGKGFEDATPSNGVHEIHTGGEDGERGEDRGMEVDAGALKGFRIFG